jgi:hypothetical protein
MPQFESDPFLDPSCQKLALHIMNRLNRAYPAQTVVQSFRCYDAYNVPYGDYPLLKCYRLSDDGRFNQNDSNVQAVLAYCLVLPDLEVLMPIMAWVRKQIVQGIAEYNLNCAGEYPKIGDSYRAEYRTMLNELTQKVHTWLRVSFSFTE